MVAQACNLGLWGVEAGYQEFKASLGYWRPSLKTIKCGEAAPDCLAASPCAPNPLLIQPGIGCSLSTGKRWSLATVLNVGRY